MKGHVPTPDTLCEKMVMKVFAESPPSAGDRVLYPGCGDAPFAAAVERVCDSEGWPVPRGLGVDTNPDHLERARERELSHVEFQERDFLADDMLEAGKFEYIIGNPPYVPIEGLNEEEKERFKASFSAAHERFDLYLLFFERAVNMLESGGLLSFVTPEKFEYVDTAEPLRRLLTQEQLHVLEIEHIEEDAFTGLVTFPCVTTLRRDTSSHSDKEARVLLRDGTSHTALLPTNGESWAPAIRNVDIEGLETGATLDDVTVRVSCGVATGADSIFVFDEGAAPTGVEERWIRPTVSGSQLRQCDGPDTDSIFLCPYLDDGSLAAEDELGSFGEWAKEHRDDLEDRSCVKKNGKQWYAWHENPPMQDILQPKIVWKDIAKEPKFWAESTGDVVPRHSVYYLIPREGVAFDGLLEYLNSPEARMWMEAHCQKAANGFYRLQSRVLKQLPVPKHWAESFQATL